MHKKRHQRPKVRSLGPKWKFSYWEGKARKRTKVWSRNQIQSQREAHSSLMLRTGARPEVARDNMGHANIDVTQKRSWA